MFDGWPVHIGRDGQPVRPHVVTTSLSDWARAELGTDPLVAGLADEDWLVLPQQRLLGIVRGGVFHDDTGRLSELRALLSWYPDDVWWWMLACQWQRIAQEEPFVQRTAEEGDEAGSAIVAARQVRDCMRLALLIARRYWPYAKWLGTSFTRLPDPDGLGRAMASVLGATDLAGRERHLVTAYQALAQRFNALSGDLRVDATPRTFHDRPAMVIGAERFAQAALSRVGSAHLRGLPLIGSVDQLADSTDLVASPALCQELKALYLPTRRQVRA